MHKLNKKISLIVFLVVLLLVLAGCSNKTGKNENENEEDKKLDIIVNGETKYDFLCAKDANTEIIYSLKTLVDKINNKTGLNLKAYRDTFESEEGRCEVLVGKTNRLESNIVYEKLPENGYAIEIVNNCLVIAGTNDCFISYALYEFENKVLNNSELCSEGKLLVTSKETKKESFENSFSVSDILKLGYTPYVSINEVLKVNAEGDLKVAQGACSDSKYIYFILRDTADSKAIIKKYDMDYNFVSQSDVIYLGHGNDMTYDSKNNRIIVAHGVKESNTYSIVDLETLSVKSSFKLNEGGGGSITYNESKDLYATSKGGEYLSIYDADFNMIKNEKREEVNYTAQGVGSDEDYIYFPMSGSLDNILATYDWDGNFICNIIVPTKAESESMFYANGKYFLNFYIPGLGASLYEMIFTFRYE